MSVHESNSKSEGDMESTAKMYSSGIWWVKPGKEEELSTLESVAYIPGETKD